LGANRLAFQTVGTTRVVFEPLDFIARLAALEPKPRVNLTRFHALLIAAGLKLKYRNPPT